MNDVISQIRRIFSDDGKNDRDFTTEELKLRLANDKLKEATSKFIDAASMLSDTIRAQSRI